METCNTVRRENTTIFFFTCRKKENVIANADGNKKHNADFTLYLPSSRNFYKHTIEDKNWSLGKGINVACPLKAQHAGTRHANHRRKSSKACYGAPKLLPDSPNSGAGGPLCDPGMRQQPVRVISGHCERRKALEILPESVRHTEPRRGT